MQPGVQLSLIIIGRAIRREIKDLTTEAETTAGCFGLGVPADFIARPTVLTMQYPGAASALVELAMTCPGLYTSATSWLPEAENYQHQLLYNWHQAGQVRG